LKSKLSRARARISGRYAIATALILAIGIPTVAIGSGEGRSVIAGKRNPRSGGELTRETEIISSNGTYGTRQSNKRSGDGGGAIYGCRSDLGREPCVRANNLRGGRAFEFETVGREGGNITVRQANGVPFTTNATGKVANLNADRIDDKDSTDFAAAGDLLFAAVADGGTLVAGRGATASGKAGNETTVTFGRDVSKCSFTATANGGSPQALAARAGGQNTQVVVAEPSETPEVPTAFHLQVIC
jgi:hypothetical protein